MEVLQIKAIIGVLLLPVILVNYSVEFFFNCLDFYIEDNNIIRYEQIGFVRIVVLVTLDLDYNRKKLSSLLNVYLHVLFFIL